MNLLLKLPQIVLWKLILAEFVAIEDLVRLRIADVESFKHYVS